MAARLPLDQLTPAYRHRLEAKAAKMGVAVGQLRASPPLAKSARGHAESEGHGHNPEHIEQRKGVREQYKAKAGKRGLSKSDIKRAISKVKSRNITIGIKAKLQKYGERHEEHSRGLGAVVPREDIIEALDDPSYSTIEDMVADLLGMDPEDIIDVEDISFARASDA